jgi:hypothetical protein
MGQVLDIANVQDDVGRYLVMRGFLPKGEENSHRHKSIVSKSIVRKLGVLKVDVRKVNVRKVPVSQSSVGQHS